MKLIETRKYRVTITTRTGLYIGSGKDLVQIGGIDNSCIKTMENEPYIPGSSLKGKLRSLYELYTGNTGIKGGVHPFCSEENCEICRFFGIGGLSEDKNERKEQEILAGTYGPTRFLFRDLTLSEERYHHDEMSSKERFYDLKHRGINPFEIKYEVAINRHTSAGQHPRPLERVPAGIVFTGELAVRIFEGNKGIPDTTLLEDDQKFGKKLANLERLLENDYLGGQGSRGSGQVKINFQLIEE